MAKFKQLDNVDIASIEGLEDVFASTVEISTVDSGQIDDPGWSLAEAAKSSGVTERTIRRWIKQRRIPAWKVDGPRGPEWRVHRGSHLDTEDKKGNLFESTVVNQMETVSLIELVKDLQNKLTDAQEQLKGASYRNGYLEGQVESFKNELYSQKETIKLLTDSQHKPGWWSKMRSWFVVK
jgi:excisionase family DNA binding protein